MTTENNSDNQIAEKVRKLLEKAHNVAGTPEADAFNAKAFELMAKYAIDEDDVRGRSIDKNIEDSKLIIATFKFGKFTRQRNELLWAIASSLHCTAISKAGGHEMEVFGVARHIRRVKMLHGFLSAQMLAGAAKSMPSSIGFTSRGGLTIDAHRESWMVGFARGIRSKIDEVEQAAIRQRDLNAGDTRMAVRRLSDRERAERALRKRYPRTGTVGPATQGGSGYSAGYSAGRQSDVGQTRVGAGGQRSIGA